MIARNASLPLDVDIALLDTLHDSVGTLSGGNVGVALVTIVTAYLSNNPLLFGLTLLLLLIGALRVGTGLAYRRARNSIDATTVGTWHRRTNLSVWAFSATLGVTASVGILAVNDAITNLVLVSVIAAYAATGASRSAGLPTNALGQIILSVGMVSLALLVHGDAAHIGLGLGGLACMFMLFGVSRSIYKTLLDAFLFGREKQTLAEEKQALVIEISEHAAQFDTALANVSHGLAMFDCNDRLVICNQRFGEFFGFKHMGAVKGAAPVKIIGAAAAAGLIAPSDIDRIEKQFLSKIRCRAKDKADMTLDLLDGRTLEFLFQAMDLGGAVVVVEDVTERDAQNEKIAHMARFDKLTNLPNRAQFEERLEAKLEEAAGSGECFAVVCIDLDHFKEVNDTLTHMVGDQLLIAVGDRLRASTRSGDHLARFGGDEFVLIMSAFDRSAPKLEIAAALQQLTDAVGKPYEIESHTIVIGMSAGVAIAPSDGMSRDDILRAADLALYKAKQLGRGTFRFFEASFDAAAQERRQIILDMRAGIARNEFFLAYQPIINIKTGRIASCEALMRWNHPTKRMFPDQFISVAEDTGLILELGVWAINQACRDAAAWPEPVSVAVNLSPVQFKRGDLVKTIKQALDLSGLDPCRLDIEITESLAISSDEATKRIVDDIIGLGCSLSLDDFGTGYSTFGYLISFPFKKVKLDKGFTEHIETRPEHRAIIRAVGQMAQAMKMSIVAEGVEKWSQLEILELEKVHYAQGWLFSKSVATKEIPWKKFETNMARCPRVAERAAS